MRRVLYLNNIAYSLILRALGFESSLHHCCEYGIIKRQKILLCMRYFGFLSELQAIHMNHKKFITFLEISNMVTNLLNINKRMRINSIRTECNKDMPYQHFT